ncbi:hypothetical protein AVEN_217459-1 [Araneus ventricosus]|uniref:Uncharacterized protein n=1 Tax=Araneus ventricosus TaxID=182803 RepID=A0A4Y2JKU5_ARAVE|nr:hypothetical protein AVEN_217459-1 [Araneus ventricosus]
MNLKPCSHGQWFGFRCLKNIFSPAVGTQRIAVARQFLGCLDSSGELTAEARASKDSETADGDLCTVSMGCCSWCTYRGNGGTVRILNDNKSPSMTSSKQTTDHGNKALNSEKHHYWGLFSYISVPFQGIRLCSETLF